MVAFTAVQAFKHLTRCPCVGGMCPASRHGVGSALPGETHDRLCGIQDRHKFAFDAGMLGRICHVLLGIVNDPVSSRNRFQSLGIGSQGCASGQPQSHLSDVLICECLLMQCTGVGCSWNGQMVLPLSVGIGGLYWVVLSTCCLLLENCQAGKLLGWPRTGSE